MIESDLIRLGRVVGAFRDMASEATIAAVATEDGGASHLTYGDVTYLFRELLDARERLDRIAGWHSRETGPAGTVGDYCTECGELWPCDTRRMAEGTYVDLDDDICRCAEICTCGQEVPGA